MKPKFKILSIDGGGIRGVIPCKILEFIESQTGGSLADQFDLLAGTSTGGIISLGLSTRKPDSHETYTASEMLQLYRENGRAIFQKRKRDLLSRLGSLLNFTEQLTANPYESANIENILTKYFDERKLSEVNTDVLVTTYDIEVGKPFYFSSRLAKHNHSADNKEDFLIKEIARSTSAAPTYFEPSLVQGSPGDELVFVDGGVFANNPSILAYAEAKELHKLSAPKAFLPVVQSSDDDLPFYMLSLGTGTSPKSISGKDAVKWRTAEWLNPLLSSVFMQSVAESTHYTMQHLLPPYTDGSLRYQRFNMNIPEENSEMDDASVKNIDELCDIADAFIKENEDALLGVCEIISAE
jgi:patatin-like phospholipase/acyl hydrolase